MNLTAMIASARQRAVDTEAPYLWSNAEWVEFANEAERDACRRARLLVDSTSDEVVELTLAPGDAVVDLDPRVLFIRRARLVGRSGQLQRVSHKDLDACTPDWEDETGDVRAWVPDMDTGKFRPYPKPTAAGTVRLTVVRLPLGDMGMGDEPEIAPHLHAALIDGMLARAYAKPDSQTFDAAKAEKHEQAFAREFGPKSSAQDEAWIQHSHGFIEDEGLY